MTEQFRRKNVKKISGGIQSVRQKYGGREAWHNKVRMILLIVRLFSFEFPIVRGSLWTREAKSDAPTNTKLMKNFIIKFIPMIALKRFDMKFKLSINKCI